LANFSGIRCGAKFACVASIGAVEEALGRAEVLEPGMLDQVPELRRVIGARNRVIHSYDAADVDFGCRHESS
jgi:hypothetical protein